MGMGPSGKFLCCRRGKSKNPLVCGTLRCRARKAQGANPWRRQAAFLVPGAAVFAWMGVEGSRRCRSWRSGARFALC